MKRILVFLLVIVVIVTGLIFSVLNADKVMLDYYFGRGEYPLALIMVLSLAVGALLGVIASLGMVFKARGELRRLRKDIKLKDKEVANLRALPLHDRH